MPLSTLSSSSSVAGVKSNLLATAFFTSANFAIPSSLGSITIQNITGNYTSFTVSRTGGGLGNYTSPTQTYPINSFTDPTVLINNAQYTYTITPTYNSVTGTAFSGITNLMTNVQNGQIYSLATVTGLAATSNGAGGNFNQISFTYTGTNNGTSNNYTSLSIQYPAGNEIARSNFVLGSNTFTANVSYSPNTQYIHSIYAVNGDGLLNNTAATITTCTWAQFTSASFIAPSALTTNTISIGTVAGAGSWTSYTIFRGPFGGSLTSLATAQTNQTYSDTNALSNNTRYSYALYATNSLGYTSTIPFTNITNPNNAGVPGSIYTLAAAPTLTYNGAGSSTTAISFTFTGGSYTNLSVQYPSGTFIATTTTSPYTGGSFGTNVQNTYSVFAINGDGYGGLTSAGVGTNVGAASTSVSVCTWASAPTLTYNGPVSSTSTISFTYSGGTFTSLSIQTTLGTPLGTSTTSPYTSPSIYTANQSIIFYACPVNALGYYSTSSNYASVSTCTWGSCNAPTFGSTTSSGTTLTDTGTFSKVYITYSGGTASPASGTTVTGTNTVTQGYTTMTAGTYTFNCFPVNALSYQSSNSASAGVTIPVSQPAVTGGTLIGYYSFYTSVTDLPSPGNGTAPSITSGGASISSLQTKFGAGSLLFPTGTFNYMTLGTYTFTNNNSFSIAFWLYPIRTSISGNSGTFSVNPTSTFTSGAGFFNLIQNANANATNNVRWDPFINSGSGPTHYITGDQWTHIACIYNGSIVNWYVNGSYVSSYDRSATPPAQQRTWYFFLGQTGTSGTGVKVSQYITAFRIYDGQLTAGDVTNIYNWTQ